MAEFAAFTDDVPLPEPSAPHTNPVGTVRVEDWSRRLDPTARRAIRVAPEVTYGYWWVQISGPRYGAPDVQDAEWFADSEVRDWHVAPLLTLAIAFRHAEHERAHAAALDGSDTEGAAPFKDGR